MRGPYDDFRASLLLPETVVRPRPFRAWLLCVLVLWLPMLRRLEVKVFYSLAYFALLPYLIRISCARWSISCFVI